MSSICVIYFPVFAEIPFGIDALHRNVIQILIKKITKLTLIID